VSYAEYVVTGWVLTGAVLGAYWAWLVVRTRRARDVVRRPVDRR